jgi:hypothetical protein
VSTTTTGNTGPLGQPRGIGFGILLFIITLGFYGWYYKKAGREPPVTGWTGLWLFPFGIFLIPAIVWFVKVQGALNQYWESKAPAAAPT